MDVLERGREVFWRSKHTHQDIQVLVNAPASRCQPVPIVADPKIPQGDSTAGFTTSTASTDVEFDKPSGIARFPISKREQHRPQKAVQLCESHCVQSEFSLGLL